MYALNRNLLLTRGGNVMHIPTGLIYEARANVATILLYLLHYIILGALTISEHLLLLLSLHY